MELGEAPKSPWRYPHLMFRESRKHKAVSFKKSGKSTADILEDPRSIGAGSNLAVMSGVVFDPTSCRGRSSIGLTITANCYE